MANNKKVLENIIITTFLLGTVAAASFLLGREYERQNNTQYKILIIPVPDMMLDNPYDVPRQEEKPTTYSLERI